MSRVCIGIPCYGGVSSETLDDYMRLAYYLGRRTTDHEFTLAIKGKSEQFRARNAIVEAALQSQCEYLLFLDDDHVIDWEGTSGPNSRYGMVQTLIGHMEADPKVGIVGAVYYHRGAQCRPVLMKQAADGGTYWMRDDEITGQLQEVAVQGGGCMLLRMSIFDDIKAPWFEPEFDLGTDLQICGKARDAGWKVCCDTSIKIGHVLSKREVVTPENRNRIAMENARQVTQGEGGIDKVWANSTALGLYRSDAEDYMGMPLLAMGEIAMRYDAAAILQADNMIEYYATRGKEQLARQLVYHHTDAMRLQYDMWLGMVNTSAPGHGLDFGCGSAPVGFELVMRGHTIDFVDVDGSTAYDFTKWRAKKRGKLDQCGWELRGPYDYALMFDSIEHLEDWKVVLTRVVASLKPNGALITNYILNQDYDNPEHISMDKPAVQAFLVSLGCYPLNQILWQKNPQLGAMDSREAA